MMGFAVTMNTGGYPICRCDNQCKNQMTRISRYYSTALRVLQALTWTILFRLHSIT